MKLNIKNLYAIRLRGHKDFINGITLKIGKEWILLKYIPVDYVFDGYILVRTKYIHDIVREENEIFTETVVSLKDTSNEPEVLNFDLDSVDNFFYNFMEDKTVIQFDFHDDTVCYLGRIIKLFEKSFQVKVLDPKGNWVENSSYIIDRIRTIRFDNDYINSLLTYNNWLANSIDSSKSVV